MDNTITVPEFFERYQHSTDMEMRHDHHIIEGWIKLERIGGSTRFLIIRVAGVSLQVMCIPYRYRSNEEFEQDLIGPNKISKGDLVQISGIPTKSHTGILSIVPDKIYLLKRNTLRQSDTYCSPCGISSNNENHWSSLSHKMNMTKEIHLSKKNSKKPSNLGLHLNLCESPVNVFMSDEVMVNVHVEVGVVKVFSLELISQLFAFEMLHLTIICPDEEITVHATAPTTIFHPNEKLKISVTCFNLGVTEIVAPVVIFFQPFNDKEMKKMIFEISATFETSLSMSLQPKNHFAEIKKERHFSGARESVRFKSNSSKEKNPYQLEFERQIKEYKISPEEENVIKALVMKTQSDFTELDQTLYQKLEKLTKDKLMPSNYIEKMLLFLKSEHVKRKMEINCMDLENVNIEINEKGDLLLKDVYLNMGGNQVRCGDMVYITEKNSNWSIPHQAWVKEVSDTWIVLNIQNNDLLHLLKNEPYCDVHFTINSWPYRLQNQALELMDANQIEKVLFPSISSMDHRPNANENKKISFYNKNIASNTEQKKAVQNILSATSGNVPFCLWGPPGTGKTETLVEAVSQVAINEPNSQILVCAASNAATNEIATRLLKNLPCDSLLRLHAKNQSISNIPANLIDISNINQDEVFFPCKEEILRFKIIICTLLTSGMLVNAKFPKDQITHVFIDEAGQATETEALIPIVGLLKPGGQIVLGGDPQQLGPLIQSTLLKSTIPPSLLDRLMSTNLYSPAPNKKYNNNFIVKLVNNYRSHPALLKVPSDLFYNKELVPCADEDLVNSCKGFSDAGVGEKPPIIVHGIMGTALKENHSASFYNVQEIVLVIQYISKLISEGKLQTDIGVVTPYNAQVKKLKDQLKQLGLDAIDVGTVETFQGQEKTVIIVSTVKSSPSHLLPDGHYSRGFLQQKQRFNVGITRARALLIVVGNPFVLKQMKEWNHLLEFANEEGCYAGCSYNRTTTTQEYEELASILLLEEEQI